MDNISTKDLIPVNNGEFLKVYQYFNGDIIVETIRSDGSVRTWQAINAADFATMYNWYNYQNSIGNADLAF